MIRITPKEFSTFATFIRDLTGIALDQNKTYLVETRLAQLAQQLGCVSFAELYLKAKADASKAIASKIIDAITTNETLFFRDSSPFALFQNKILPDLIDRRSTGNPARSPIRIWSAACSTGQEVYSLAMVIKEMLPDWSRYQIKILGTDISDAAVSRASYGIFNKIELDRGLPAAKLNRFFDPVDAQNWKIKDELRAMATFRRYNLLEASFSSLGRFDLILCRNVAIYFAPEDKIRLFQKLAQILEPDGYLIIGSSESLLGITDAFVAQRHCNSVYYQLKGPSSS